MRGLYRRFVFPWLLESSIGGEDSAKERAKALEPVHGEVLEVGFGTGLNLPHYPRGVTQLVALDLDEMLPEKVSQRIAAASFPVERVRSHLNQARRFQSMPERALVLTDWVGHYRLGPMVRRVPTDRIERLIECATEVFIDQGYRRTQMSDIASALGVAKGTLYVYVDSKEALFDLVARYADDLRALPKPVKLPVATPRPGATVRYVRERLSRNQVPKTLVAALGARRVGDAGAELSAIAGELFDTLATNRRGIKLLDRSARDLPELAALWFQGARGGLIQALQSYLDDRVRRGLLRAFPDTAVAARIAIEALVFWAVHRHWDPQPQIVEEAAVRDTVIKFIVNSFANR